MIGSGSTGTDNEASPLPQTGLTIYPAQWEGIDRVLSDLVAKVPARFVLLADRAGQCVSHVGAVFAPNVAALGALVAADLAASREIATIAGDYQQEQMILREGDKTHFFISEAGPSMALLVQVDNSIPLGWARLLIQEAAKQLGVLVPANVQDSMIAMLEGDAEALSDQVDHAMDGLWTK